eukprot:13745027-Alexandrium_andersonii.AAC.1
MHGIWSVICQQGHMLQNQCFALPRVSANMMDASPRCVEILEAYWRRFCVNPGCGGRGPGMPDNLMHDEAWLGR